MPDSGANRRSHPAVILVATDLSELDRLMPFALEQAAQTGARLILLHAIASSAALSVDAVGMPYFDPSAALEFADKALGPWCEAAHRRGIACDGLVREGHATQQIEDAVRQFQADRVLLGTRSRSRLGKMLLGSVAEQVLRSVNLPVITVGPEAHLAVDTSDEGTYRAACHHTQRDLSPERGACLPNGRQPERKTGFAARATAHRNEERAQGLAHSAARLGRHARTAALAEETSAGCCLAVEPVVVHGNPSIEILPRLSSASQPDRSGRDPPLGL